MCFHPWVSWCSSRSCCFRITLNESKVEWWHPFDIKSWYESHVLSGCYKNLSEDHMLGMFVRWKYKYGGWGVNMHRLTTHHRHIGSRRQRTALTTTSFPWCTTSIIIGVGTIRNISTKTFRYASKNWFSFGAARTIGIQS